MCIYTYQIRSLVYTLVLVKGTKVRFSSWYRNHIFGTRRKGTKSSGTRLDNLYHKSLTYTLVPSEYSLLQTGLTQGVFHLKFRC